MALRACAWRLPGSNPETRIYHYREGVPDALRVILSKRKEKVSLRTRDPQLARLLHAAKAADIKARWPGSEQRPRRSPIVNSTNQEWALAGENRRRFAGHEDNRGRALRRSRPLI